MGASAFLSSCESSVSKRWSMAVRRRLSLSCSVRSSITPTRVGVDPSVTGSHVIWTRRCSRLCDDETSPTNDCGRLARGKHFATEAFRLARAKVSYRQRRELLLRALVDVLRCLVGLKNAAVRATNEHESADWFAYRSCDPSDYNKAYQQVPGRFSRTTRGGSGIQGLGRMCRDAALRCCVARA